ncbi:MAG: hypothetical protein H0V01_13370 [Bacteroidetes bacterium]|nr:hypothetical protein [Bacteroidota bacterium]HET6244105.1 hypothetical protein [Bacteroidia bacterium]
MNNISKKKPYYKINERLFQYLDKYKRVVNLTIYYNDLLQYAQAFPLIDKYGKDTLWETIFYDPYRNEELNTGLTQMYSLLKTDGDISVMEHLYVDRIDFCTFGNSKPFRVRIVNQLNDNYDYFYIKRADASRIYGLELEHMLSPNHINYFVSKETLIEEHIAGIPGDNFILEYLVTERVNKVRIAKEFVKFNERCFVRLLGDMRSYNYVIDITPDFEDEQYRIRAIDFDQQSYEGRKSLYLPQFYKENSELVKLCSELLNPQTIKQYQFEERTLIGKRLQSNRYRMKDLMDNLNLDTISSKEKIVQLREELSKQHESKMFLKCNSMAEILRLNIKIVLNKPAPF